jgi:hypothetical protein
MGAVEPSTDRTPLKTFVSIGDAGNDAKPVPVTHWKRNETCGPFVINSDAGNSPAYESRPDEPTRH